MAIGDLRHVRGGDAGTAELTAHFVGGVGGEQGVIEVFAKVGMFVCGIFVYKHARGGGVCGAREVAVEYQGIGPGYPEHFAPEGIGLAYVVQDTVGDYRIKYAAGEG